MTYIRPLSRSRARRHDALAACGMAVLTFLLIGLVALFRAACVWWLWQLYLQPVGFRALPLGVFVGLALMVQVFQRGAAENRVIAIHSLMLQRAGEAAVAAALGIVGLLFV